MAGDLYTWVKALHVIAVLSWMAGMLYLPRLFVYHCSAEPGSELSETLKVMERRLMRAIMNPAMFVSVVLGLWMLIDLGIVGAWMHAKLACAGGMIVMHMFMARWRKDFEADRNTRSHKFYRITNEVPTLLMIIIVIMAVVEPF